MDLHPKIEPDSTYAQLLIQITLLSPELKKIQSMMRGWGVEVLDMKPVTSEWTLLKLSVGDMREVAFRLTQSGSFNIKGINASPPKD